MSSRPRSQKLFSQNKSETHDHSDVPYETLKGETQLAELNAKEEERTQGEDADDALEEAKVPEEEPETERLKKEYAELLERRKELQHQIQRHLMYKHFMERVQKITKFEDVKAVAGYAESLLRLRDQFYQKAIKAQDEVDQQKKALLTLEDQHNLVVMQKNNLLSQLQTELEKARAEAVVWEEKWEHIIETAAQKTLELGKIKMATLNLYEMTSDAVGEKERVDMYETEMQLDKLKMFFEDQNDIVKQYQARLSTTSDGQKPNKDKKNTKPRKK